jgi:hypothetical protein
VEAVKWFFLIGNVAFALACLLLAIVAPSTIGYTAPAAALSALMAFVIWSDCRGEWRG